MSILSNFFKSTLAARGKLSTNTSANASANIAAKISKNDAAELISRAKQLYESGQYEPAHEHCRQLLSHIPDDLEALDLAVEIALKRRLFTEIDALLQSAFLATPDCADLYAMCGRLYVEQGDFTGALEFLQKAVQLDPYSAKAHNSMGAALQILGQPDHALQCFQRAQELAPAMWRASYNIGNVIKLHGRFEDAVEPFQRALRGRRQPGGEVTVEVTDFITSNTKLKHDIEQLTYLAERGILDEKSRDGITALGTMLESMKSLPASQGASFPPALKPLVAPYYNRLTNFYNAPALPGGALNQDQDWAAIEAAYFANAPGMTYVDNFLKPEALASLRRFCMESTIWFDFRYAGGYVGCSCEDGFICPLLAQIAEEQRLALPSIFGENRIRGLWGYKYDSQQTGISAHADYAAVNVNFWITPDEANLDRERGGLVIWDKEAPLDWNFDDYNNNPSLITDFLRKSGAKQFVVPHRQNRVVLFNSDLFHKTDDYRFKPGYENRRINITMLYGDRLMESQAG